jgi:hypothetical protein
MALKIEPRTIYKLSDDSDSVFTQAEAFANANPNQLVSAVNTTSGENRVFASDASPYIIKETLDIAIAAEAASRDTAIADAKLAIQKWLEAVQLKVQLPDPTTLDRSLNYLCKVINDGANNGVYQLIAQANTWAIYSTDADYVDEAELTTKLADYVDKTSTQEISGVKVFSAAPQISTIDTNKILYGDSQRAIKSLANGDMGQVLTGNGTSALPSFKDLPNNTTKYKGFDSTGYVRTLTTENPSIATCVVSNYGLVLVRLRWESFRTGENTAGMATTVVMGYFSVPGIAPVSKGSSMSALNTQIYPNRDFNFLVVNNRVNFQLWMSKGEIYPGTQENPLYWPFFSGVLFADVSNMTF